MTATCVWMFWHIQGEVFSSKYLKNQKCTSLENVREFSFVFLSSLQTNFGQLKVSTSWVHLQYASQAETNFHLNGICRWKSQKMWFFFFTNCFNKIRNLSTLYPISNGGIKNSMKLHFCTFDIEGRMKGFKLTF
jgi:hypothetical protein